VNKLSSRLEKFKWTHGNKEDTLNLKLEKLNLDKYILLKEKLNCVWNEKLYEKSGPIKIKGDVRKHQLEREKIY
jgi:hypothetical protein